MLDALDPADVKSTFHFTTLLTRSVLFIWKLQESLDLSKMKYGCCYLLYGKYH
ncbi:hypothetical protein [Coxiella endosymbiont of Ornithodoros maritimus]|uniref:hypothetical protein n=1 Tax=Coxiella endosymbiont of Ornithodoros maritimus TaxID=1656172 RepID=UPI0022652F17|nr:hypothetical protein [Coxiella endosymbiont of Ornithodoros maritimus]